jgi:flagellar protein FliO/FliZ
MSTISTDPSVVASPDLWMTLLKSAAMLSIVLAIVIGVLWVMKRLFYNRGGYGEHGIIKMLASCYVAPKERILLIDVMGEKILIGVTNQSITCLANMGKAGWPEIINDRASGGAFMNLLKGLRNKE